MDLFFYFQLLLEIVLAKLNDGISMDEEDNGRVNYFINLILLDVIDNFFHYNFDWIFILSYYYTRVFTPCMLLGVQCGM